MTPRIIRSINQPDQPPDWWWNEDDDEDEEEPMTAYGLTITDAACEWTARSCPPCTDPTSALSRHLMCTGCNGDGTRTVPLDRDATPLAQAVANYRACADLLSAAGLAMRDDDDTIAAVLDAALALFPMPLWPCSRRRTPPMSDTPTTAEEVVREAIDTWRNCYDADDMHGPTMPATIVAALRSSPEALADLNGGEWVQPKDAAGKVPVWFQKFRDAWPEKRKPSEIGRTQPLFIFVPREDR